MKSYILIFTLHIIDVEELKKFLDRQHAILNWMVLPNGTAFLVSKLKVAPLSKLFAPTYASYLITEYIHTKSEGMLPYEMWTFLNDPEPYTAESDDGDDDDDDDDL